MIRENWFNRRDHDLREESNGVYSIKCSKIQARYIGETERALGLRIREYQNPNKYLSISQHLQKWKHN